MSLVFCEDVRDGATQTEGCVEREIPNITALDRDGFVQSSLSKFLTRDFQLSVADVDERYVVTAFSEPDGVPTGSPASVGM